MSAYSEELHTYTRKKPAFISKIDKMLNKNGVPQPKSLKNPNKIPTL
jgi:hypothetical protein